MEQGLQTKVDTAGALHRMRAHWLAHVVHDLRGPLFAARGYARLLLDDKAQNVTVTQRRYLAQILENVNKLAVLVNGLQEFPSGEALNLEPVGLRAVIAEECATLNGPDLTLQIQAFLPTDPLFTLGDRAKLTHAVHKLLGAMVEFSRSGGKVEVHARLDDDELTLRISAMASVPPGNGGNSPEADFAAPCEIFRLHGGTASFDVSRPDARHVSVRLPLIR